MRHGLDSGSDWAACGLALGDDGYGGGSLLTPILVLLFRYQPAFAVGTDIAHGAVLKTFGALRHRRLGTVNPLSGWMLIGSAPASLAGVALATWLRHRYGTDYGMVQAVLGAALVLGGLGVVAKVSMRTGIIASISSASLGLAYGVFVVFLRMRAAAPWKRTYEPAAG